ncbi:MAG: matrixin family metalloprotease, partial [Bacteriovoracaceae bacterium]
ADTNATGIDSLDVKAALEESLSEWNASAPISLRPVYTSSPPAFGSGASFRFSSNPAFFGAGVLAVTSVGYNSSTGSIYSADIVMNDSFYSPTNFTALKTESSGSQAYLGDVISHEIGHLLGLNHSEVGQSSMIFSIFKGQYSPHSDDIKGLQDLYSTSHFRGIKGKVVGENMAPVFGAHVQAIDVESNQVAAGVFSDEQGNFYFKGLEANKSYALYMNPIRSKENLPEYYSTFQANFCDGNSFQPSFFSKCGGRNLGRAQIIKVDSNSVVNVGNFTVKCSTSAHPEYLRQKLIADEDSFYTAMDYLDDYKTHATFTGYFSQNDLNKEEDGKGDRIRLDLSGLDVSSL